MKNFKKTAILIFFLSITLFFAGCQKMDTDSSSNSNQSDSSHEVNAISVYHWWYSGGELAAIDALSDVFIGRYPDTAAMITPVLGGGGMEMVAKIKPMVLAGEAPDTFVAHPGYEILPYVNEDLLQPVNDIWESENLESYIPKAVQEISKVNGEYYSIPLDIHRNNLIWFNKALLNKNKIDVSDLNDWDSFFSACDKLRAAGIEYPIQMARAWTAIFSFHGIVLSQGLDFYEDYVNGKITSADDPRLIKSLTIFKKYLTYVNPDSADISWDEAIDRVIKGESAFNMMGDWANGEFALIGMKFDEDYGAFSSPGTDGLHLLVVDAFVKPKNILHPTSSTNWLKTVASREGQDAFNTKKGSISSRSDSDQSLYDDYQRTAMDYFQSSKQIVDFGVALSYEYRNQLEAIIADFVANPDVSITSKEIAGLIADSQNQYLITWSVE